MKEELNIGDIVHQRIGEDDEVCAVITGKEFFSGRWYYQTNWTKKYQHFTQKDLMNREKAL